MAQHKVGRLEGRWGVSWQIVPAQLDAWPSGPPEKSARALQALLGRIELDIAAIRTANEGA